MSEPIIIETPAPPTRERLVLVPPDAVSRTASEPALNVHTSAGRDATPADLERGGYERLGPEVLRVSAAEWRELKLRAEGREAHGEPGTLAHLRNDLRDAISRAEAAEGLLIQRETELRLAREDGAAVERQMREARSAADASFVRANRAEMRAETAERERDEAKAEARSQGEDAARLCGLLATLRAERDEASKTLLEAGCGSVLPLAERVALLVDERAGLRADLRGAKEFARALEVELDTLRAELARLTAPGEGEPTDEPTDWLGMWNGFTLGPLEDSLYGRIKRMWRAGVAHERARHAPAPCTQKDRATDEELVKVGREAWNRNIGDDDSITAALRATTLAVAARVRQERCLIAQAVAANVDIRVAEDVGGGFMVGVHAHGRDEELERAVPASDAPTTLARLLGEVSRG